MSPAATLDVHPPNGPHASSTRPKSQKEMTKAERRELQEQQRAAKAAKAAANGPNGTNTNKGGKPSPVAVTPNNAPATKKPAKGGPEQQPPTPKLPKETRSALMPGSSSSDPLAGKARGLLIFSHFGLPKPVSVSKGDIHPAIARLALQFSNFKITGANARCIATLTAFKVVCFVHVCLSCEQCSHL